MLSHVKVIALMNCWALAIIPWKPKSYRGRTAQTFDQQSLGIEVTDSSHLFYVNQHWIRLSMVWIFLYIKIYCVFKQQKWYHVSMSISGALYHFCVDIFLITRKIKKFQKLEYQNNLYSLSFSMDWMVLNVIMKWKVTSSQITLILNTIMKLGVWIKNYCRKLCKT